MSFGAVACDDLWTGFRIFLRGTESVVVSWNDNDAVDGIPNEVVGAADAIGALPNRAAAVITVRITDKIDRVGYVAFKVMMDWRSMVQSVVQTEVRVAYRWQHECKYAAATLTRRVINTSALSFGK